MCTSVCKAVLGSRKSPTTAAQLASGILSDKRAAAAAELADVRAWALSFSRQFIADARENPLIAAEALFWRPDRASNADLAGHYGLIHGIAIGQDMSAEQLREMLQVCNSVFRLLWALVRL